MNQRKIGAILSYASIIISTAISLIYTPYMLKTLGESEHGLFSLVNSIVAYFTLMDFGFGNAIVRYSAKYIQNDDKQSEGKLLGMFLFIYSILGFIIMAIGIFLSFNVALIFSRSFTPYELDTIKVLILIGTFNIALSFPFSVFNASIQAHQQFFFSKATQLIKHILNPLIMVIILKAGYKSVGMISGILVLNIIFIVINLLFYITKIRIKVILSFKDFKILKEISIYSFYIFLNMIVDKINWSTDQLLLGIYAGTTAVSIYSIASTINSYYLTFSTSISGVFLPEITSMVERKVNDRDFSDLFIKIGRIQFLILGLIASGFVLFGKEFIAFWAGSNYETSYYIALLLIIPVTIPLIQNIGIIILQAKNKHKFRSIVYILIAILNIIMSIPLTKFYGGVGAAIGTAISLIIGNFIIMNIYYYKKINIDILRFWENILNLCLGLIIPIIIVVFLKKNIIINNWWTLLIHIVIYSILYFISMWFVCMSKYEKNIILNPIKKVLNL